MLKIMKKIIANHKFLSTIIAFILGLVLGFYILLFVFAKDSAKLSSLSTILSFLLGQIFTVVFITYQINENRETNIDDKKDDVINSNGENIIEIVSGIKTIMDYKADLSLKLGKDIDTGDNSPVLEFISDIDKFKILYSDYYTQVSNTLALCKNTKNKFIIYDIHQIDDILIPLEKIIEALNSVKRLRKLSDLYLNIIHTDKINEKDTQYLSKININMGYLYNYMFTKINISKLARELYSQLDNLQEIKENNKH